MGLRLRKSIKLGKNTRLNISKSGIGMSTGVKGFRVGVGPKGVRTTASIPGTGISYTKQISGSKKATVRKHAARSAHRRNPIGSIVKFLAGMILFALIAGVLANGMR